MAVKIRLQRKGRKKTPFYHIVIADARAPRDGRFIEKLGTYNPMTKPATIEIDRDKAYDWLVKGAQPSDTVRAILRFKGVLFRKHLMRGVAKGALTQEDADRLYQDSITAKDTKVAARVEKTKEDVKEFHARVSGKRAPKKVAPVVVEEVAEAPEVEEEVVETEAVAETEAVVDETPAADETPAEETETPSETEESEDK